MPEITPEPDPDPEPGPDQPVPTSEEPAWRPTPQGTPYPAELPAFVEPPLPWVSGEIPGEGRLPGTRRLWLAGGLAVAVLIATATAIAVLDSNTDAASKKEANHTASDTDVPFIPGFSASADGTDNAPAGKAALSSPRPSGSGSGSASASSDAASPKPSEQGSDSEQVPGDTAPSKTPSPSKSPTSKPVSSRKSLQSVNYPDRYWHLSNGLVRLDPVGSGSSESTRQEASFKVVPGLDNSNCYSFTTADGSYLRHRNFYLRADRNDGSGLFRKDATFCPRTSPYTGAVMLESINYPGRYLRHRNFQLRLEKYDNTQLFRADSAFRVVNGWT